MHNFDCKAALQIGSTESKGNTNVSRQFSGIMGCHLVTCIVKCIHINLIVSFLWIENQFFSMYQSGKFKVDGLNFNLEKYLLSYVIHQSPVGVEGREGEFGLGLGATIEKERVAPRRG